MLITGVAYGGDIKIKEGDKVILIRASDYNADKIIRRGRGNKVLGKPVRLEGKGHLSTDLRALHDAAFKK